MEAATTPSQNLIRFLASEQALEVYATSPINIALVKYWGKLDEEYIIPLNPSLSITIDQTDLCSRTHLKLIREESITEKDPPQVKLILNGKEDKVTQRILNVVNAIRLRTQGVEAYDVESSAD